MSMAPWLERTMVVVSITFPENGFMISLWLGRAGGKCELGDLFPVAATGLSMRAREGGWCQPLVKSKSELRTRVPTRLPGSPSSLFDLGQAGVGKEVTSLFPVDISARAGTPLEPFCVRSLWGLSGSQLPDQFLSF